VKEKNQASTMNKILSRLDKTKVFGDLDDFSQDFELNYTKQAKLSTND
jgi:hypothetical protein